MHTTSRFSPPKKPDGQPETQGEHRLEVGPRFDPPIPAYQSSFVTGSEFVIDGGVTA